MITEEIIPEVEQVGAEYIAAQGFTPKQALEFMTLRGIDLSAAPLGTHRLDHQGRWAPLDARFCHIGAATPSKS